MDHQRYSFLAHRRHRFCCPTSPARAELLLGLLEVDAAATVLDVGCGKAEWLLRACERFGARGLGLEHSPLFVDDPLTKARLAALEGRAEVRQQDVRAFTPGTPYDAVLCIGSSHAVADDAASALRRLTGWTRLGGRLLFAEPYWRREPSARYLGGFGAPREAYRTHDETAALGEDLGLRLLYTAASSEDEWDEYEGLYAMAIERFAAENPEDPDAAAMLERARGWRRLYLRWGRETLGFGWYLFERA